MEGQTDGGRRDGGWKMDVGEMEVIFPRLLVSVNLCEISCVDVFKVQFLDFVQQLSEAVDSSDKEAATTC